MMQDTASEPFVTELSAQLGDVFATENISVRGDGRVVTFVGKLLRDAESTFAILEERFKRLGYLPILRRIKGRDTILATPAPVEKGGSRVIINLLLFLATVGTVVLGGALQEGYNPLEHPPIALLSGVPFAVALLSILGTHELAHFLVARARGMRATLPYFIPIPFHPLGTFGAVIKMESPIKDRKMLFDVGIAGPLAGLVISIIALVVGLRLSEITALPPGDASVMPLGTGILVDWITDLVLGPLPDEVMVILHPIAFAGWFGIFITAMNLIPISQLDGGHIGYAFFGHAHRWVVALIFLGMLLLGLFWTGWLFWGFFIFIFGGLRHPPPLNDITPLDTKRKLLAILAFALLFLLGTPRPFG
jgi:membrane-associated protease RseP (regulator of RpoE activity)